MPSSMLGLITFSLHSALTIISFSKPATAAFGPYFGLNPNYPSYPPYFFSAISIVPLPTTPLVFLPTFGVADNGGSVPLIPTPIPTLGTGNVGSGGSSAPVAAAAAAAAAGLGSNLAGILPSGIGGSLPDALPIANVLGLVASPVLNLLNGGLSGIAATTPAATSLSGGILGLGNAIASGLPTAIAPNGDILGPGNAIASAVPTTIASNSNILGLGNAIASALQTAIAPNGDIIGLGNAIASAVPTTIASNSNILELGNVIASALPTAIAPNGDILGLGGAIASAVPIIIPPSGGILGLENAIASTLLTAIAPSGGILGLGDAIASALPTAITPDGDILGLGSAIASALPTVIESIIPVEISTIAIVGLPLLPPLNTIYAVGPPNLVLPTGLVPPTTVSSIETTTSSDTDGVPLPTREIVALGANPNLAIPTGATTLKVSSLSSSNIPSTDVMLIGNPNSAPTLVGPVGTSGLVPVLVETGPPLPGNGLIPGLPPLELGPVIPGSDIPLPSISLSQNKTSTRTAEVTVTATFDDTVAVKLPRLSPYKCLNWPGFRFGDDDVDAITIAGKKADTPPNLAIFSYNALLPDATMTVEGTDTASFSLKRFAYGCSLTTGQEGFSPTFNCTMNIQCFRNGTDQAVASQDIPFQLIKFIGIEDMMTADVDPSFSNCSKVVFRTASTVPGTILLSGIDTVEYTVKEGTVCVDGLM